MAEVVGSLSLTRILRQISLSSAKIWESHRDILGQRNNPYALAPPKGLTEVGGAFTVGGM
jgi:hypothetical protein